MVPSPLHTLERTDLAMCKCNISFSQKTELLEILISSNICKNLRGLLKGIKVMLEISVLKLKSSERLFLFTFHHAQLGFCKRFFFSNVSPCWVQLCPKLNCNHNLNTLIHMIVIYCFGPN